MALLLAATFSSALRATGEEKFMFGWLQAWGREDAPIRILALHGWMDNAATWDHVAPLLVESSGILPHP